MATKGKARQDKIWYFDVTDPQLHPNGFTIYRVTCKVFMINSPESLTETIVWKRYNDFKQLFKAMFSLHRALHRRDIFPEFAKPKVFGRFEESVIEERRQSALRLLRFISEQPHLSNSNVLKKFLEGGKILPASTFYNETNSILAPNKIDLLSSGVHSTGDPPDILQTVTITTDSISLPGTSRQHSTVSTSSKNNTTDTLDIHSKPLEGTWNFPQIPDNISLGSSTGEDTDLESSFGTPLKDSDLAVFDPILSNDFSDLITTRDWLNINYNEPVLDIESMKYERGDTLTKDSSSNSRTSSVRTSIENLLDTSHHGHGDATLDLGEFDPLRQRSVSSNTECGKGDIDLSNSSHRTGSVNSQISLPSTPKSGHSSPRCQSPAVKQRSNTNTSVSSLTQTKGDYLVVAASQIGLAQECEINGNYEMAFAYYKIGVDVLIQGVQGDTDRYRQDAVRRKTAQYLLRAEEIYNNNLSKESLDDFRWAASSCISPNLDLDPSFALIRGSLCELRNYKVLGTIDTVILVMDKLSDETFVIKTVHKSSAVLEQKTCLLPTSSPYMCNLLKFFETENAVYLLLQYASGGKLWNYIGAYLHGRTISGFDDGLVGGDGTDIKNVYTGQQLTSETITDIDNVKTAEDIKPKTKSFNASEPISFTSLQNKDISSDTQEVTSFDDTIEEKQKPNVQKRKKRLSSFSSAELTFDENDTVVKTTSDITDDQFNEILNNNNQSLQYFTINSFDSNSDVYQRMDSNTSTSEHIPSIPEEIPSLDEITSTVVSPSHDDVFDCDPPADDQDANDIIRSSKALIKSVDRVLSDSDRVFNKEVKSKRLSNPGSIANVSHDSEETSIYDLHKPSDDSSETSDGLDSKRVSAEIVHESKTTDLKTINTDTTGDNDGLEYCDKTNDNETVICSSPQYKPESSDMNTSLHTGRKRTLSRMNSKTLTRSASFECDLKSPSKNRARAVSNLFDRLDCVEPEQIRLLESCIRQWASEIVVAVSKLHHVGIICRDLNPDNILLGDNGHIMLTYFSRLPQVDEVINQEAAEELYAAPEVLSVNGFDETCDWWSLGALLYELLVGQTLLMCHPGGINSHTNLYIPSHVSQEGQGLLQELLRFNPKERLGSSIDGVEAVKSHPFFNGIDWNAIEGS